MVLEFFVRHKTLGLAPSGFYIHTQISKSRWLQCLTYIYRGTSVTRAAIELCAIYSKAA